MAKQEDYPSGRDKLDFFEQQLKAAKQQLQVEISERERAEEALRTANQQLKANQKQLDEEIEKTQRYLDVAGTIMVSIDSQQKVTLINRKGCDILGYKEEEILGKNWFDNFLPKEVRDKVRAVFHNLIDGKIKIAEYFENPVLTKEGEERIILWHNAVLERESGNIVGTLGSGVDITKRNQAEQALARERNLLQTVVDTLPDCVFAKNADTTFVFSNRSCANYMQAESPQAMVGKTDFDFLPSERAERYHVEEQQIIQTGQPIINNEVCIEDEQGRIIRWLLSTKVPWCDDNGNIMGLVGLNRDITKLKYADEKLRESEERFRNLTEYIPGVSIQGYDTDGVVFYWNKASEEVYGYTAEEAIGKKLNDLIIPPDVKPHFRKALAAGKTIENSGQLIPSEELILLDRYGCTVPVYSIQTAVKVKGQETSLFCINVDLSERKLAEGALKAANQQLQASERQLRATNQQLDATNQQLRASEAELYKVNNNLHERIKDLDCLYGFSKLDKGRYVSLEQIFCGLVNLIPPAWEYSEIAAARIIFGDNQFKTDNFRETAWTQSADIKLHGQKAGTLEVCYLEDKPIIDEGPFSKEDRKLLNTLAKRLGEIADRKLAEKKLKTSEEKYRCLFENSPDMIAQFNREYEFLAANPAMAESLDISAKELFGKKLSKLMPQKIARYRMKIIREAFNSGQTQTVEHKRGERYYHTLAVPFKIHGEDEAVQVIVRDFTELKQAEEKLRKYQGQLKFLASELTLTEERERRRIATDMHERIGQSLIISKLTLDSLRASSKDKEFVEKLDEVCYLLNRTIQDTKSLIFDLGFPILYELGFEAAVSGWLAEEIQEKQGIASEFEEDGQPKPLDDDVRVLLFRNVRELLINIVKHANANKVKVSVRKAGSQIQISVVDDGVGFNVEKLALIPTKKAGFGIFSIRERLEQIGGECNIESKLGCGTKIILTAPLRLEDSTIGE